VLLALALGAALIAASGNDVLGAYAQLLKGAVGDTESIANTLRIATTLLFMSLAFTIALRAGVFNLGTQGQFLVGAFAGAWVGFSFTSLPGPVIIILALAAGSVTGAAWVLIPALLRVTLGVTEIVTTLMSTFIAVLLSEYLVIWRFNATAGQTTATPFISPSAELFQLLTPTRLTWALLLGVGLVVAYGWVLRNTRLGYELEMIGSNPRFARYGGIAIGRGLLIALLISGAIAGLGGAQEVLGVHYRFISRFSPDVGLTGIVVSLLGQNRPLGLIAASLLLGGLQNGATNMELFTDVHRSAVAVITALIIMLAAAQAAPWLTLLRRVMPASPSSDDSDGAADTPDAGPAATLGRPASKR
jgi:simple sugar transport system permease protein